MGWRRIILSVCVVVLGLLIYATTRHVTYTFTLEQAISVPAQTAFTFIKQAEFTRYIPRDKAVRIPESMVIKKDPMTKRQYMHWQMEIPHPIIGTSYFNITFKPNVDSKIFHLALIYQYGIVKSEFIWSVQAMGVHSCVLYKTAVTQGWWLFASSVIEEQEHLYPTVFSKIKSHLEKH